MKIIIYLVQAIFFYFVFIVIKLIGLKLSRKLFSNIFIIFGPFFKSKQTIYKNLEIVFPNMDEVNKKKLEKSMWSNYGKVFVEYFFLNNLKKNNSHIKIKGINILEKIKMNNKPVIFISGHFANFELMSMELIKHDINLATIYRPLNNFFINPMMEYVRRKNVCKNQIQKGIGGVKQVIKYLEKKFSIALMIDQRLSEGEKLPFFGKDAFTTIFPANLAKKFNLSIVPIYIKRLENNNFEMQVKNPIEFKGDKITFSKELNSIIEKFIIKNPDQWIWTHNRWKL